MLENSPSGTPFGNIENWKMNYLGIEDSFIMKPVNELARLETNDDIIARRIKNRDRQRRYRARKRLEADMKKAITVNNSIPPQLQVNGVLDNSATRKCNRDWKMDARKVHEMKETKVTSSSEGQATPQIQPKPLLEDEVASKNSSNPDTSERIVASGRRHWKAEARNKEDGCS